MTKYKKNKINKNTKMYLISWIDELNGLIHNFVVSMPDTIEMNDEFAYHTIVDSTNNKGESRYTWMLACEEAYEEYGSQWGYKCYKALGGVTEYERIEYVEIPHIHNRYFWKVNKN